MAEKTEKTEEEWRMILTPKQYNVLREKGTEPAFSGKYDASREKGVYLCVACGQELFRSDSKYDSGTGWPSFSAPVSGGVEARLDDTHGMKRIEVVCSRCGGHLGHVFSDGPKPTGKRYCVNSVALEFRKGE